MKAYISDRTSEVGKQIEKLCGERNYTLLAAGDMAQADILFLTARRAASLNLNLADNKALFDEVDYNLKSAFLCVKGVIEEMKLRRSGVIIFIGSGDSEKPNGSAVGFSISMGGMKLLFREVCQYLAGSGIRCCWLETGELCDKVTPLRRRISRYPPRKTNFWTAVSCVAVRLSFI
jgi:NAD(P)-dependent dehydrogenase (short-subunit alcohol dehydrogenase family)